MAGHLTRLLLRLALRRVGCASARESLPLPPSAQPHLAMKRATARFIRLRPQ